MALGGLLDTYRNSRGRGQANSSLLLALHRADPLPHTGVRSRLSPGAQRAARKLSQKAWGCGRPVHLTEVKEVQRGADMPQQQDF